MLNTESGPANRTAVWSEVPELKGRNNNNSSSTGFQVTDAWTGSSLGCVQGGYSVELESHDVAVLVVSGEC